MQKLRGKDYNIDGEIEDMKKMIADNKAAKAPFFESLKTKASKKSILIVFGCQFFQQFSGINAVGIYTNAILQRAGVAPNMAPIGVMIFGVFNLGATYSSTILVEKLGRKISLMMSSFFVAVSIFVLGLFMSFSERAIISEENLKTFSFVPLVANVLYIMMFEIGLGPVPWLLAPELFPGDVKAILSSIAGVLSWGLGWFMSKFYIDISNLIGGDICFYFFGFCSFLGVIFEWFCVFETKGKSLDEIQQILSSEKTEENK